MLVSRQFDRQNFDNLAEQENHLVPFSRGPRMCLGINLAWCEVYLVVAMLFRKFEITIANTEHIKNAIDKAGNLKWYDAFLAWYFGEKVRCWFKPINS